jgi:hypothetical protein
MTRPEQEERGNQVPEWHVDYTLAELDPLNDHDSDLSSPEEARDFIRKQGYPEHTWDYLIEHDLLSHEVRAMIITARGTLPRIQWVLRQRLRLDEGSLEVHIDPVLLFTPQEIEAKNI